MTEKVKMCCHLCQMDGWVMARSYPSKKWIKVCCPGCDGKKYIYAEKVREIHLRREGDKK